MFRRLFASLALLQTMMFTAAPAADPRTDLADEYVSAIQDELAAGVTPQNNAALPLVRVFGPRFTADHIADEFFRRLNVTPPGAGTHLVSLEETLEDATREARSDLTEGFAAAQRRPWAARAYPDVARWLEGNREPLARLEEAVQLPRLCLPLLPSDEESVVQWDATPAARLKQAAQMLNARAMNRLKERKTSEVIRDLATIGRIVDLIGQQPGAVNRLLLMQVQVCHAKVEQQLVESNQLTEALITQLERTRLPRSRPRDIALIMNREERFAAQLSARRAIRKEGSPFAKADEKVALAEITRGFDEIAAAMKHPTAAERTTALAKLDTEIDTIDPSRLLARLFVTNHPGKSLSQIEARRLSREAMRPIVHALAKYRLERRRFPDRLAELSPKYLAQLPIDPFANKAFGYRLAADRMSFRLYSVGENGIDDGGRYGSPADDITFDGATGE